MTIEQKIALVRQVLRELNIARVHLAQAAQRVADIREVIEAHGYSEKSFPFLGAQLGVETLRDVMRDAGDAITRENHSQLFPELHARIAASEENERQAREAIERQALAA